MKFVYLEVDFFWMFYLVVVQACVTSVKSSDLSDWETKAVVEYQLFEVYKRFRY